MVQVNYAPQMKLVEEMEEMVNILKESFATYNFMIEILMRKGNTDIENMI